MATRNYNPFRDDPDALWDYGMRIDDYKPKPQEPAPNNPEPKDTISNNFEFRIINKNNSWLINGIKVYGQKDLLQVELSKKLLDNGAKRTHVECIAQAKVADKSSQYRAPSAPLLFGLQHTLYKHRNDKEHKKDVEQIRSFLQEQYKSHWLWTLSQVEYQPKGKDTITHDVGLFSECVSQCDVKGERDFVKNLSFVDGVLQQIFGIADAQAAQELGNWLTKKSAYLWRYKQSDITTPQLCGVFVDSSIGRFVLGGYDHVGNHWPSLGVQCNKVAK